MNYKKVLEQLENLESPAHAVQYSSLFTSSDLMFIQIFITTMIGIIIGIITGLTPGIHINLVSVILLSSATILLQYLSPLALAAFIIAVAITHTFLDAVPSIYLGAPDESKALSVLPGHRLLLKGLAHQAIVYTTLGALAALLLALFATPLFIITMKYSFLYINKITAYLLIIVVLFLIFREITLQKKLLALLFFFASGILGLLILQNKIINQPLFLLLSGLFGTSVLIQSILENSHIPIQKTGATITLDKVVAVKAVASSSIVGFLAAFLPGFGSSQAAILAIQIVGNIGDAGFLMLVGGISTANTMISIVSSYTIEKARSGAIVAISQLLGSITTQTLVVLLFVTLIAAGIAVLATLKVSRLFCSLLKKVNYRRIAVSIILFIVALAFFFDSFAGIIILATTTSLGILATKFGIGKNHLMGCLIVPVILFFLV